MLTSHRLLTVAMLVGANLAEDIPCQIFEVNPDPMALCQNFDLSTDYKERMQAWGESGSDFYLSTWIRDNSDADWVSKGSSF
jgi:hypothetical protein